MRNIVFYILLIFSNPFSLNAILKAKPSEKLLTERWTANWITCPNAPLFEYGVYIFRKNIHLNEKSQSFVINISADNRYRLFVNDIPACLGPARGDMDHWYFETIDIAHLLNKGNNILAVEVWNFGQYVPGAQITLKTALIVQGNTHYEEIANTNNTWKVIPNSSYSPSVEYMQDVGCSDIVDASLYPWGWQKLNYKDELWQNAINIGKGQPYGTGTEYNWTLLPRDIPILEESLLRLETIRRTNGIYIPKSFLNGKSPLVIGSNKKVSFLIDQEYLTTAYPELIVSGGKNSQIKLTYSEALFDKNNQKGNRNEIEGKSIQGYTDQFYPDGGENRLFRPLWFRTYRFIQVDIETKESQLIVEDIYGKHVGYPFIENAKFESSDKSLKKIWDVGWHTALLCANETYYDCPYYEQLQYVGDTRIQSLISLYVDGDDRLMRKAINMFNWSRSYEGITTSRYPAKSSQFIPPYSLYWINMVNDYRMHRNDSSFVKGCIPGVKTIIEWFTDKVDNKTGMIGETPHWNFVDWATQWPWDNNKPSGGVPPGAIKGGSAILTLQFAYALKDAIELLKAFGEDHLANEYTVLYKSLCQNTWDKCWDKKRNLLYDDLNCTSYSQHANIMGILSDAVPETYQRALFNKITTDTSLIQTTFYYRFYLFEAMLKTKQADKFISMLEPWKNMLEVGLTTFAENPEPTRSDCHAWSSSPIYYFLSAVAGITPSSPGFRTVSIEPNFGELSYINCKVPHPSGLIELKLKKNDFNNLVGEIILPMNLIGSFKWKGVVIILNEGKNQINTNI